MRPICGAAFLVVLFPALALADEFSEFRIPAHQVSSWTGRVSSGASRFADNFFSEASGRAWSGDLSTRAFWLSDSDARQTFFSLDGLVGGQRSTTRSYDEAFSVLSARSTRSRFARESWMLDGAHRIYPGSMPLALEVAITGRGNDQQSWVRETEDQISNAPGNAIRQQSVSSEQRWRYITQASGQVTAGVGRVRDATSVFEARILEQRLSENGALVRPLSPEARGKLATLLALRGAHASILERPGRTLWREVEQLLREDGALGDSSPGAPAILRAGEPSFGAFVTSDVLPVSPILRQTGAFAGLVLVGAHTETLDRLDFDSSFEIWQNDVPFGSGTNRGALRFSSSRDDLFGGVAAEIHRPVGMRWQFDGATRGVLPLRTDEDGFTFASSISAAYIVNDRWLGQASFAHERSVEHEGDTHETIADSWAAAFTARLIYYFEDHVQMSLTLGESQRAQSVASFGRIYERSGGASLALTYRFLGRLSAPGLIEPLRTPATIGS